MIEILIFEIKENIRSRWIFFYSALLGIAMLILSFFGDQNGLRLTVSAMNLLLIVVPLFSITFASLSFLESMPFAEVLLTKSVTRTQLFFGKYFGTVLSLVVGLLIGVGIPGMLIFIGTPNQFFIFIEIIAFGIILTAIFVGLAFMLSSFFRRGEMVLTASLLVWFYFSLFFDSILFILSMYLGEYPIEIPSILIILLNPLDLIRIIILLQTSSAALLGFSGAILMSEFGMMGVILLSCLFLTSWLAIPVAIAFKKFKKRNF
jgi:Cu-processing system permease protein